MITLSHPLRATSLIVGILLLSASPALPENFAMRVASNGDVGVGTETPTASLHVKRVDGSAQLLVEEGSGTNSPRSLAKYINNGNTRIELRNIAAPPTGRSWFFELQSNGNFNISRSGSGQLEAVVDPSGNMTVTGDLTVLGAGGCSGCDGMFQPEYKIESIEEHAEFMWEHSYLPAVGPSPDGESVPMSLGKRHQAVLNELEKAHIYIERLNERLKTAEDAVREKESRIASLEQRLQRVESVLVTGRKGH